MRVGMAYVELGERYALIRPLGVVSGAASSSQALLS